eukprot:CAMPEP_0198208914 /NCGR_PEP_ID=MMETSP1445-20131203/12253_1 /TAXON_ID=36898 /ORGANISM="Pyramimonas sp., Strain CCMP2087" /LENGTH=155 /DNA_ID=CAMNT_0043882499 /DNA_START=728 /DNA_END=1195 /DNA_ORIENTATION=-
MNILICGTPLAETKGICPSVAPHWPRHNEYALTWLPIGRQAALAGFDLLFVWGARVQSGGEAHHHKCNEDRRRQDGVVHIALHDPADDEPAHHREAFADPAHVMRHLADENAPGRIGQDRDRNSALYSCQLLHHRKGGGGVRFDGQAEGEHHEAH